jgi:acyl transferase domain-containing protein
MAVVGGVNLMVAPEVTVSFSKAHLMAPDGRCKTFDAGANGYVRSEGCGVVVLKRLSDAVADRDHIVGVIRGSAVVQDGRSNGLTAPNGLAQQAVIRAALDQAGIAAGDVAYVETHGTGTSLGDTVEVAALWAALREGRAAERRCTIGSVKTNLGHLEAAAGIAGLIKTLLALDRQRIPPHLHVRTINPELRLEETALDIAAGGRSWPRGEMPRVAGVSSFGFGGTIAHAIVEEAPERTPAVAGAEPSAAIVTLSAKTPTALRQLAGRLERCIAESPEIDLADISVTTTTGRVHFPHRAALVVCSIDELREALARLAVADDAAGASLFAASSGHVRAVLVVCSDPASATMLTSTCDLAGIEIVSVVRGEEIGERVVSRPAGADLVILLGSDERIEERCADLGPVLRVGDGTAEQRSRALSDALAWLYVRGANLRWDRLAAGNPGRRVPLPTYPFTRRSCWLDRSQLRTFTGPLAQGALHARRY